MPGCDEELDEPLLVDEAVEPLLPDIDPLALDDGVELLLEEDVDPLLLEDDDEPEVPAPCGEKKPCCDWLELPPAPFSIATVCESRLPEAARPCCFWNFLTADFVFGPILPSTGPALMPLSLSACWIWLTREASLAESEADCDAPRFAEISDAALGLAPFAAELLPLAEEMLLFDDDWLGVADMLLCVDGVLLWVDGVL